MNKLNHKEIKGHIEKSRRLLDEVTDSGNNDKMTKNKLRKIVYELETARESVQSVLMQVEEESGKNELSDMLHSATTGTAELVGNEWLRLRIESVLPSGNNHAEIKRLSKTVTNLLDCFAGYLGYLPEYEQAFLAIIEYRDSESGGNYDHDNKGYRAIPNALKGRVFADDNQFTMSLGLFTVEDSGDPHCEVYVIPLEDMADFASQYLTF